MSRSMPRGAGRWGGVRRCERVWEGQYPCVFKFRKRSREVSRGMRGVEGAGGREVCDGEHEGRAPLTLNSSF